MVHVDDAGVCEDELGMGLEVVVEVGGGWGGLYFVVEDVVTCETVTTGEE